MAPPLVEIDVDTAFLRINRQASQVGSEQYWQQAVKIASWQLERGSYDFSWKLELLVGNAFVHHINADSCENICKVKHSLSIFCSSFKAALQAKP